MKLTTLRRQGFKELRGTWSDHEAVQSMSNGNKSFGADLPQKRKQSKQVQGDTNNVSQQHIIHTKVKLSARQEAHPPVGAQAKLGVPRAN
eukprot:1161538-Pelagomonas_calceolata.AAC.5